MISEACCLFVCCGMVRDMSVFPYIALFFAVVWLLWNLTPIIASAIEKKFGMWAAWAFLALVAIGVIVFTGSYEDLPYIPITDQLADGY